MSELIEQQSVDRSAFEVVSLTEEGDDRAYWQSKTPTESPIRPNVNRPSGFATGSARSLSMPREIEADNHWLDGALYPDQRPPDDLPTLSDRVDFLARLCSAWDFGQIPWPESIEEVRKSEWAEVVEACGLLTSPAYHLLRRWHGLAPLPYLGQSLSYIRADPFLQFV